MQTTLTSLGTSRSAGSRTHRAVVGTAPTRPLATAPISTKPPTSTPPTTSHCRNTKAVWSRTYCALPTRSGRNEARPTTRGGDPTASEPGGIASPPPATLRSPRSEPEDTSAPRKRTHEFVTIASSPIRTPALARSARPASFTAPSASPTSASPSRWSRA